LGLKIAEGVKDELKMDRIDVKFVPVNPQTRIPLLVNGTIDQECGSTTNTLGRQKQVDFTYTTFLTGTKIVVKKRSGIKEIEDLKGKPIAVNMGTTNEKAIKAVNEAKGLGLKIVHVKEHSEALVALETGRVDAYGTDDVVLYALIHKSKNPDQWEVVGRFLSYDPYGVMIRRNDADFRLVANKTLCGLFRSGEIYAIYDKWFKSINMPVSDRLRVVFETQAFPE
jgi:glutamate/aspartate transport system substrate-binding protein